MRARVCIRVGVRVRVCACLRHLSMHTLLRGCELMPLCYDLLNFRLATDWCAEGLACYHALERAALSNNALLSGKPNIFRLSTRAEVDSQGSKLPALQVDYHHGLSTVADCRSTHPTALASTALDCQQSRSPLSTVQVSTAVPTTSKALWDMSSQVEHMEAHAHIHKHCRLTSEHTRTHSRALLTTQGIQGWGGNEERVHKAMQEALLFQDAIAIVGEKEKQSVQQTPGTRFITTTCSVLVTCDCKLLAVNYCLTRICEHVRDLSTTSQGVAAFMGEHEERLQNQSGNTLWCACVSACLSAADCGLLQHLHACMCVAVCV
eukprot:jgi/Chlat1/8585/Chrsp86S07987